MVVSWIAFEITGIFSQANNSTKVFFFSYLNNCFSLKYMCWFDILFVCVSVEWSESAELSFSEWYNIKKN